MTKLSLNNLTTKILICLAVWLLFAGLALAAGLKITGWLTYRRLSNGIAVYGTVTAREPENHQIIRYSYSVGQQTYSGTGHGGRGNPSFGELSIGDRVVVFYDPANPSLSCMGYPQAHQRAELWGIIFLVILLPLSPLGITIILIVALSKSKALTNHSLGPSQHPASVYSGWQRKHITSAAGPQPAGGFVWELLVARIWSVYMGLCHLGSFAGVLIPVLLRNSLSALGRNFAMTSVGLIRDVVGITTAVVILTGSRRARIGLIALIPLNTAYFIFWMVLMSVPFGVAGILFGLALYLPPLILMSWRYQKFRP